uniref:Nuclear pore complex protein n=1 Tax=Macrostomum lignano TaxID=282301 RepID=A0A1I8JPR8_9PLAT
MAALARHRSARPPLCDTVCARTAWSWLCCALGMRPSPATFAVPRRRADELWPAGLTTTMATVCCAVRGTAIRLICLPMARFIRPVLVPTCVCECTGGTGPAGPPRGACRWPTTSAFSFPTAAHTATFRFRVCRTGRFYGHIWFWIFSAPAATTATSGFRICRTGRLLRPLPFGFAAPAASTPTSVFGFAAPAASTATSGFGFCRTGRLYGHFRFWICRTVGLYATSGFGFAAPSASTATSGFGFAAPAASAATSGFAFPAPAGSAATSAPFGFGKPAGAAVSSAASFGAGFGAAGKLTLWRLWPDCGGACRSCYVAAASAASSVAFFASLTQPALFPDERTPCWPGGINCRCAQWGAGKGFCSHGPVEYQPGNPFCRLKSVCYNALPAAKDEDGLVGPDGDQKRPPRFPRPASKDALFRLLGNKPNLTPHIEEIRGWARSSASWWCTFASSCRLGGASGFSAPSWLPICPAANEQTAAGLLKLQVTAVQALVSDSDAFLLITIRGPAGQADAVPGPSAAGVPLMVWQQARRENPDPESLLPVPLVGLEQAQARMSAHSEPSASPATPVANGCGLNRRPRPLAWTRPSAPAGARPPGRPPAVPPGVGQGGRPDSLPAREEQLRSAVEQLLTQLPTGRLRELASQVKLGVRPADRDSAGGGSAPVAVSASSSGGLLLDAPSLDAVMTHLAGQHRSVGELVRLTNVLARDLDTVQAG